MQTTVHPEPNKADNCGKRIGILIVAYNAATTLKSVLRRIPDDVWENVEEIALFDDASADETYELALGLQQVFGFSKLSILKHTKNLGYGGNQKAGYRHFLEKGFDAVVLLHGDGQYAPEMLADLYGPIVRGEAEAVFGSRMMKTFGGPLKGGMPLYKYVGNRILTFFENKSLGMDLTEFHSGYRAYSLAALAKIEMSRMTDDFHYDTEIIIKLHHQGFRIAEVPIPTYYGSEICYVNGMRYAADVFRAVRDYRATLMSARRAPAFAEYFAHYPLKESRGSSHQIALELAGTGNTVLDLGCGEGFFAAKIAARGNQVTGVDVITEPACRETLADYFAADLLHGELPAALPRRCFDRVLLLDVLEHLLHPEKILQQARELTRQGSGQIVVSLPNVANVSVRLMLLFGRFDYAERGILDRTHLRFYTRATARKLLEREGYEILEERMTLIPVELALAISPKSILARFLNRVLAVCTAILPGVFGYQILLRARPR